MMHNIMQAKHLCTYFFNYTYSFYVPGYALKCMCVRHVCARVCRGEKRVSDLLDLELCIVVSHQLDAFEFSLTHCFLKNGIPFLALTSTIPLYVTEVSLENN